MQCDGFYLAEIIIFPNICFTRVNQSSLHVVKVSDEERTRPNITETGIYFDPEDPFIDYMQVLLCKSQGILREIRVA